MGRIAAAVVLGVLSVVPLTAQRWVVTETGTASIQGTVTTADGSGPLVRAEVHLEGGMSRVVRTDEHGRYAFRFLPRGRYSVAAARAGYLTTGAGAREPGQPPRRFRLREGESRTGLDVVLPKAGVIEVFVSDERGDPLEGVWVQAARRPLPGGKLLPFAPVSQYLKQNNFETDDRGLVRLTDLPPGDYVLTAHVRRIRSAATDSRENAGGIRRRYVPVSYPAQSSVSEARTLSLGLGQEIAVSMQMAPLPAVRVAGRVLRPDGSPMTKGSVRLNTVGSDDGIGSFFAVIGSDGTFKIDEVIPQPYVLTAGPSIGEPKMREHASVAIEVPDTGLSDLVVITHKAARLRGRIVVDRDSNAALFDPARFSLMLRQSGNRYLMARLSADGGVTLDSAGGEAQGWVWHDEMRGHEWFLKSVRLKGRDITDSAVQIEDGEDVDGLEVVVTQHAASLSGSARDEHGEAPSTYRVLVFAADPARWTSGSRFVATQTTEPDGRFALYGLPPGHYLAVAVEDSIREESAMDPAFLASVRSAAMEITLDGAESHVVTLPFVEP